MTFAERQIDLQFSTSQSTANLGGLRCIATIMHPGGSMAQAQLEMRVWGMTNSQMNEFSSVGMDQVALQNVTVKVMAGAVGQAISQVFEGSVRRAYMDFSGAPDVAFVVSAQTALVSQSTPAASNSYPGYQPAEDIIKALATLAGMGFANPQKAHAMISNAYLSGSVINQLTDIAKACALPMSIENNTVTIWPNDGPRDEIIIELEAGKGLVGYPTYWEAGFVVKSEFNPMIANGRTVRLKSVIPKSNGDWPTQNVTHEISAQLPDGPWFTTAILSPSTYVPRN